MSTWNGQKKIFAPLIERPAWGSFARLHLRITFLQHLSPLHTSREKLLLGNPKNQGAKKGQRGTFKMALCSSHICLRCKHRKVRDK